jgi:hypothetical protein
MARSSAKVEYRVMTSTTNELVWIKQLLMDIGIEIQTPIKIFCDNQAVRHIASNLIFYERTKYIEVNCHCNQKKLRHHMLKAEINW